ncbi:hypothetical protein SUDANB15_02518 [Streptomyces sp. enrichment culture]
MIYPVDTLDLAIRGRQAQNAAEALTKGILRVDSVDARLIEVGTAAVMERWRCLQDHGFGVCNQPLIPEPEVAQLLGNPEDSGMGEPAEGWLTVEELDPVLGFVSVELFHHRHVLATFNERETR